LSSFIPVPSRGRRAGTGRAAWHAGRHSPQGTNLSCAKKPWQAPFMPEWRRRARKFERAGWSKRHVAADLARSDTFAKQTSSIAGSARSAPGPGTGAWGLTIWSSRLRRYVGAGGVSLSRSTGRRARTYWMAIAAVSPGRGFPPSGPSAPGSLRHGHRQLLRYLLAGAGLKLTARSTYRGLHRACPTR